MKPTKQDIKRDQKFREWVQKQPSCISGHYSEYNDAGEGRSIAAHVRRASDSGIATKPLFSAVPLTNSEHHLQHNMGEARVLQRLFPGIETQQAKMWFDQRAQEYLKKWMQSNG